MLAKTQSEKVIIDECIPSNITKITFPTNGHATGTYPIISVSNATVDSEVRISDNSAFSNSQIVPQSAGNINKFPTLSLKLCYGTIYYIQVKDNECSPWSSPKSFITRNYAKQWVENLSYDIANPKPITKSKQLSTNTLNSFVFQLEWYIEDVSNPGVNILSSPFYTYQYILGNSFRRLKINNNITSLLIHGHVYRVIVKGIIGADCGTFNLTYPLIPGDPKYRNAYFIYEDSSSTSSNSNLSISKKIETTKKKSISILSYPNPSKSGIFKLKTSGFKLNKTIQVINLNGQNILSFKLQDSETSIDLSSYKKDTYFVHVNDGNTSKQLKLITK